MTRRRIIRPIIKVGFVLAAAFVLIELLMIVTDPFLFKGLFESDPDAGFRARSYYPTGRGRFGDVDDGALTNRFGFNDRDYQLQKTPGTFRILVIGDSFGWAGGSEGNYTALLERKFEIRDGAHGIDVINTGYPGMHTGEELIVLRKFGLQYNPDLVILGFFAGNDFFDADPDRKRIVVNKYFYDISRRHELRLFGYPIIGKSRTWLFLRNTVETRKQSRIARREAEEWARANGQPVPVGNLPESTYYMVQKAKLEFFNRKTSETRFAGNIEYILESVAAMNELLKARGIKFLVAIYPDEFQVSESHFKTLIERFKLSRDDYDLDLAQSRLKTFLASKQIPYLDMLERFRVEEKRRELYRFREPHWNNAGDELAAQILFDYLNQQAGDFNLPTTKSSANVTSELR